MTKAKIVIASVMKPIQDTRAFYKFGLSLRETNKYSINIIGFSDKIVNNLKDLSFYRILSKYHNFPLRFWAQFKFIYFLNKIQPEVLIITTPELLPASILLKFFLRYKLVVDIQENTSLNMVQNNARAKFWRILASNIVSLIERYSNNWVDAYILAETCYSNEMPAIKNYISIENKYFEQRSFNNNIQINPNQALQFLMSGTLSPVYGTLEGLNWFMQLLKRYPHFQILIIGHVPIPSFIDDLVAAAKNCSQIQLNISRHPIDYEHIIEAYKQSDIHLLPYRQLPSISPKMPSKLYDCMALALPVIYSPNTKWKTYIESNSGGIEVDFYKAEQAVEQFSKILNRKFFISGGYETATYPIEKDKFLNLIQHLSKE